MNMMLVRDAESPGGFFGNFLTEDGDQFCRTLERSFDGAPKIPVGTYTCVRRESPHFQRQLFMLTDVPGHDFIEIHVANWECQLDGCIAVGESSQGTMLMQSEHALERFMALQDGLDSFTLIVK